MQFKCRHGKQNLSENAHCARCVLLFVHQKVLVFLRCGVGAYLENLCNLKWNACQFAQLCRHIFHCVRSGSFFLHTFFFDWPFSFARIEWHFQFLWVREWNGNDLYSMPPIFHFLFAASINVPLFNPIKKESFYLIDLYIFWMTFRHDRASIFAPSVG